MSFVCAVWWYLHEQNISLDQRCRTVSLMKSTRPVAAHHQHNNYRIALRKYQHYQRQALYQTCAEISACLLLIYIKIKNKMPAELFVFTNNGSTLQTDITTFRSEYEISTSGTSGIDGYDGMWRWVASMSVKVLQMVCLIEVKGAARTLLWGWKGTYPPFSFRMTAN